MNKEQTNGPPDLMLDDDVTDNGTIVAISICVESFYSP